LVTGCGGGAQNSAQQTPTPSPAPPLVWAPCKDVPDTECAGLQVPVDPAHPEGTKLTLRIARVLASDSANKRGVLIFIPGGPGVGIAGTFGGDMRKAQHIEDFRKEYDVVTFDPRGIGESSPIRCAPEAVPSAPPPADRPPTADEYKAIGSANLALFNSCYERTGELFRHLSAMDTAADVEQIRLALTPTDGLIAYGGSYGSNYGQAYLERYGDHVKAMVLDAVVDHSIDKATFSARNVEAVDDAFGRLAQWCAGDASCALHNQDPGAIYNAVVAINPNVRTLVSQLLAAGADPNFGFGAIAKMLDEMNHGQNVTYDALTSATSIASNSEDASVRAGKNGLFPGVMCADFGAQDDYDALLAVGKPLAERAPRFVWKFWDGYPIAHASAGVGDCAGWPWPATNPPHRLVVGPHPNVMVANPTHDPATPLVNALSVWLQIPQARLLIADVDGHQALALSQCAFDAMHRFFNNPASVSSTTICPK
jgi:pimeloyl-ACP methyl ester carboxylesterase